MKRSKIRTSNKRENPSAPHFDFGCAPLDQLQKKRSRLSSFAAWSLKRPGQNTRYHNVEDAIELKLTIANATRFPGTAYLRRHLKSAHALIDPHPLTELSLALVGDRKMSALHEQFLDIPGPTDVLTFPLDLDKKGRPLSGEVVICVPEARRQCQINGGTLREELLLYALHGLLHLCGFDDKTKLEFRRMHRKEDEILDQLGVGRVFDRESNRNGDLTSRRRTRRDD